MAATATTDIPPEMVAVATEIALSRTWRWAPAPFTTWWQGTLGPYGIRAMERTRRVRLATDLLGAQHPLIQLVER